MAFAAFLLENTILMLSWGGAVASYFYALPWGFYMDACPHCGALAAFPKQNDKCLVGEGGGGGDGQSWN